MVILTNLVERFYVTSEEDSIFQAVRLLLTSVLMALGIYLLLSSPALGNLLFDYPELHFFTVATLVLMGRYTGYRVTELVRFRDLVRPPEGPERGSRMSQPSAWRFWAWPSELQRAGIVGINRRNGRFILPLNRRALYPRVDEKHLTKGICRAAGSPCPDLRPDREQRRRRRFMELSGNRPEFVIKPAAGSAGQGIVVVARHDGQEFFTSSGQRYTLADLHYHISAILSGLYSLKGQVDLAIIEQRIVRHEVFAHISEGGTPDVRVVLYRCVPVMAMVRLPTRASRGKANLHQGAAGAGVDLRTGRTFGGVCMDRAIDMHPDTGHSIAGVQVPFWQDLLKVAMKLADGLELGYIGVDFVVDANLGPVVLEANARPGLNIQVANRRGLSPRLEFLNSLPAERLRPGSREELIDIVAAM